MTGAYNRTSRPAIRRLPRCCRCRRGSRCKRYIQEVPLQHWPLLHRLLTIQSWAAGVEEAGVEEVFYTGTLFYSGNRCRRSRAASRGWARYILAGQTAGLEVRLYAPLGYPFNDIVKIQFSLFCREGIPLPGRGIVGKNPSAWSKTTVRNVHVLFF